LTALETCWISVSSDKPDGEPLALYFMSLGSLEHGHCMHSIRSCLFYVCWIDSHFFQVIYTSSHDARDQERLTCTISSTSCELYLCTIASVHFMRNLYSPQQQRTEMSNNKTEKISILDRYDFKAVSKNTQRS
jgi:hypothetical protein